MFAIETKTLPCYWYAHAGHIEERIGESSASDWYFSTYEEAFAHAEYKAQEIAQRKYQEYVQAYSPLVLNIYKIRALWNPRIRESLKGFIKRKEEAMIAAESVARVFVAYLPETLEFEGQRLAIGDTVYYVDGYNLAIFKTQVEAESVSYYPSSNARWITYNLGGHYRVDSTLEPGSHNSFAFLDKAEAVAKLQQLLQERVARVQEQIEQL